MKTLILLTTFVQAIISVDWIAGRGAKLNFVEVEAEHCNHNGIVEANDRTVATLSSEASGRRAVTLSAVGQYVECTTPVATNSIVVRYSIPDSAKGKMLAPIDAPIGLYVNGIRQKDLVLTTRFSHYYGERGWDYNNTPSPFFHHQMYDETRTLLDKTYTAGSKVKLQVISTAISPNFTIDLADFELVQSPIAAPAGSISVLDYQADSSGHNDSTAALQKAVDDGKAQKKIVYIPAGNYLLYDDVVVDEVTVQGAGPWYTVLGGKHPTDDKKGVGLYGRWSSEGGSHNVVIRDLAISGNIQIRTDDNIDKNLFAFTNGISGALSNSLIENVWIWHTRIGITLFGPMNNLTIRNCRVFNTVADGINLNNGVTNSRVEHTFIRNTADDGLTVYSGEGLSANNSLVFNTIGPVVFGNNIAVYGSRDTEVSDNLLFDTVISGGGIHIANRFGVNSTMSISGYTKVFRNTLLRTGSNSYYKAYGTGAIWLSGQDSPITGGAIHIKDCELIDSSYSAFQFVASNETPIIGLIIEDVVVNGTGTFVFQIQTPVHLSRVSNLTAYNVRGPATQYGCTDRKWVLNIDDKSGPNSGWDIDQPLCYDIYNTYHFWQPSVKWDWIW